MSWVPSRRQLASIGVATLAAFASLLWSVLTSAPYFGNMDDSVHMELAAEDGPWVTHHFGDSTTGFLRHSSWILMWPQYALAANTQSATLLYIANGLFVCAVLLVLAMAARAYFAWSSGSTYIALIGAALAWPYFAELFVFPSLQEKTVLLGAALLLWWIGRTRDTMNVWVSLLLLVAASLVAFTSKVQIALLIPGLIAALWIGPKWGQAGRSLRPAAAILWVVGAIALLVIALSADYSTSTRGDVGLSAVSDRRLVLLLALLVVYSVALVLRWRLGILDSRALVPWLWLAAAVAAFLVWEIRNYYLAVAAIGISTAFAQVASWIKPRQMALGFACLVLVVGIAVTLNRTTTIFGITSSFREFLTSAIARDLNDADAEIGVGCAEAPTHFNQYARWLGLGSLRFHEVTQEDLYKSGWLLADDRLCPISTSDDWTQIWQPPRNSGYILYHSGAEIADGMSNPQPRW